jgi:hypothetical protein
MSAVHLSALLAILLTLSPADSPASLFPLRVAADGRHLSDPSGAPVLVNGDTAWSLIAQLNEADIARYLDDRASRGFNAIIVNLIEHKFASRAPNTLAGVAPFLGPGDFAHPNPAYFDYAHAAVAEANKRGIAVWLCAAYLGWDGGDEGFFKDIKAAGPAALRQYGRFVGERFKDLPNVVWMMGGDFALSPSDRWAGDELAAGLREGGGTQLMTAHGGQTSAVETYGDQSWLAIDTVYSYKDDLRPPLLEAWNRRPVRPFVLIETIYEGEHDSKPERIRRQSWTAMLSGAAGQFFGNNPIWHFDGPTLFPAPDTWQQALDDPGSQDMTRLGSFFRVHRWAQLEPTEAPVATMAGNTPGVPAPVSAATPDKTLTIVYVPSLGTVPQAVVLDRELLAHVSSAEWFNPAKDGATVDTEFRRHPNGTLWTPGDNGAHAGDWVLVLQAR